MKELLITLLTIILYNPNTMDGQTITLKHSYPSPIDGRILVIITNDDSIEPRHQVRGDFKSAQVFGQDVDGWVMDKELTIDQSYYGYPISSIDQ